MAITPPRHAAEKARLTAALSLLGVLVLSVAGFMAYQLFAVHASGPLANVPHDIGVIVGPEKDLIGLSDGSYAFDVNRPNGSGILKRQAADTLRKGDRSGALALWHAQLIKDTNDAEALIYQEDQLIIASGKPYVTLVVGTTVTGSNASAISTGHDVLQGAYVAQKEYNDKVRTSGGSLLRLLVANSGSDPDMATDVAQQIVQARQAAKIIGVMGWTFSAQTINAMKLFADAGLPMVAPTASTDDLTGFSRFFFRVAPANKTQAIAGAQYMEHQMHVRRVALFVDPNNSYSKSLANDFIAQFVSDGNKIIDVEEYKVADTVTLPAHLDKALTTKPDAIYFAGYASDLATLLEQRPAINVMGGDGLYELGGYTGKARQGFIHLQFTAFAYPDVWGMEKLPPHPFFTLYGQDFDPLHQHANPYGFTRPTGDSMLAYDAMQALLKGYTNVLDAGATTVTPEELRQGLLKIYGNQGFQGVTGQISFSTNGDPVNKAIVILHVVNGGYIQVVDEHSVQGCFVLGQCKNIN